MDDSIVIIDYGMGNIGSIANMIKFVGAKSIITSDKKIIEQAKKVILPGVGHFDRAMQNIQKLDLQELITYKATEEKIPFLGICLGMQLMCNRSEEGNLDGLKFINADVLHFKFDDNSSLKVPHMGWNTMIKNKDIPIIDDLDDNSRFYFVHSYYVKCNNEADTLTYTNYGDKFTSAFSLDNIMGVQFHPEKSHKFGVKLFQNFIEKY
jgi:glutamine amidotransferase